MSEGLNINAMFAKVYDTISTQGDNLKADLDKLSSSGELTDTDMLNMQFKLNNYNTMLEMASTVSKALTDEAKQIAQRAQ